jgi:drug/metabolite transporter (DMT)-like permease
MVGAAVASIFVVAATLVFQVPLNNLMAQWSPHRMPLDWAKARDAWLWNHWLRTCFGVLAFLLSVAALSSATDAPTRVESIHTRP